MSLEKLRWMQRLRSGEDVRIGGLDKRRLIAWFGAKEHKNLVLRVVDVLELSNDAQDFVIQLVRSMNGKGSDKHFVSDGWRKSWLLHYFPNGWVVLSIDELLKPMEFEVLKELQAVLFAYTRIRQEKGEPNRIDACVRCNGTGYRGVTASTGHCKHCEGEGHIITFIEMSSEEKALAEGRA